MPIGEWRVLVLEVGGLSGSPSINDEARVEALLRMGILDQPAAPDLDTLTRLAAFVTGAPVGIINLIDADRQWQASVSGAERGIFRREDSMCKAVLAEDKTICVSDATRDERFRDNPFVTGLLDDVRLYCGVPLHDEAGFVLGTLCVIDPQCRTLSSGQVVALQDLATQVECLFQMRRQHHKLVDLLAEVDHSANHDVLTGLSNRRMLIDRLQHAMDRAQRTKFAPTLFFCDLDGFKAVNDAHGHDAGDTVLIEIARRLKGLMRPADTVARLGGDEFVLLCEDLPVHHYDVIKSRMRCAVAEPVVLESGLLAQVGVSIGTVTAAPGETVVALLRAADSDMYIDKTSRRVA